METNYSKLKKLRSKGLLKIGRGTYGWQSMQIDYYQGNDDVRVTIGNFTSIGPNIRVITGGIHPIDWISTYPLRKYFNHKDKFKDGMPSTKGDIVIGNDVWIGTEVMILSGVSIGDGAVIMSRSVVTKDVEPYTLVGGMPAKLIRKRFDDAIIDKLLELSWWDKSDEEIEHLVDLLSSNKSTALLSLKIH